MQRQLDQDSGSILASRRQAPLEPTAGDAVAAGLMNVVYVPGKVIICTLGTAREHRRSSLVTFGTGYQHAK